MFYAPMYVCKYICIYMHVCVRAFLTSNLKKKYLICSYSSCSFLLSLSLSLSSLFAGMLTFVIYPDLYNRIDDEQKQPKQRLSAIHRLSFPSGTPTRTIQLITKSPTSETKIVMGTPTSEPAAPGSTVVVDARATINARKKKLGIQVEDASLHGCSSLSKKPSSVKRASDTLMKSYGSTPSSEAPPASSVPPSSVDGAVGMGETAAAVHSASAPLLDTSAPSIGVKRKADEPADGDASGGTANVGAKNNEEHHGEPESNEAVVPALQASADVSTSAPVEETRPNLGELDGMIEIINRAMLMYTFHLLPMRLQSSHHASLTCWCDLSQDHRATSCSNQPRWITSPCPWRR